MKVEAKKLNVIVIILIISWILVDACSQLWKRVLVQCEKLMRSRVTGRTRRSGRGSLKQGHTGMSLTGSMV